MAGGLTSATTVTAAWAWEYDANGNRTLLTRQTAQGTQSGAYTIAAKSNRLLGSALPAAAFGQDAAGNTQTDSGRGLLAFHGADGLLYATQRQGRTAYYSYDTDGLRTRKDSSAGTTHFVHDLAGHLLGEYDAQFNALREYIWLADKPVALRTQGETFFIHADHLGAPRVVTDAQGRLRWRWVGEPFGATPPETSPQGLAALELPLRYPGQYADAESGLWFNWHRYYDPEIGRYVQSDPIGLDGVVNTYAYVEGRPLDSIDPSGLIKLHGNWCGPDWTGGFEKSYDQLSDAEKRAALPPATNLDNCCRTHDILYSVCRKAHPCDASARQHCFEQADRDLSRCASTAGGTYGANIFAFGNPMRRIADYMKDSSPRAEKNSKDCERSK